MLAASYPPDLSWKGAPSREEYNFQVALRPGLAPRSGTETTDGVAADLRGPSRWPRRGKRSVKVVPRLAVDLTRTSPPWAVTTSCTMKRPSPSPSPPWSPRVKGAKIVDCCSGGIGNPSLCTEISTWLDRPEAPTMTLPAP